jgi:serine/threonine-protein kinase
VSEGADSRDDLLDEGVALCLKETETGRAPALAGWLARHPHLASDLAGFLAEEAAVERYTVSLRDLAPPATTPWLATPGDSVEGLPRVEGYEIVRELGRGGMGVVYLAHDRALERAVALKVLPAGAFATGREAQRFRFEAEAAASLDHPHIVPILAVGESGGRPFFTMKLVAGSLSARLRKDGPLPPDAAARLVAQIARAVHHAHQRGILHRDLKPGNILLDEKGEPHVADFGLARRLDADASAGSALLGTPAYMAPEQARGDRALTTAVDVYGLGAILYEMLTGRPPFQAETLGEMFDKVLKQPVVRPGQSADVPADLEAICLHCLGKGPADRYPSAAALADDLEHFLRGERPTVLREEGFRSGARRILVRIKRALGHREEVPGLVSWVAFWWTILNVVALHGGIFLLAWTDQPVCWAWLLHGIFSAASLGIVWSCIYRHYDSLTVLEKQNLAIHLGSVFVYLALFVVVSPWHPRAPTRDLLPLFYPALMVLFGFYIYVFGLTARGSYFAQGLALLPLAFVLRLVPDWAPLLFAGFIAGYFTWIAVTWRQPSSGHRGGDKAP